MTAFSRLALSRYLTLYAALYAGFGVQSPYLPSLLESRDLRPEAIALVLAAGSAVRLAAGPAAGRLADRLDASKVILSLCSTAAALIAPGAGPRGDAYDTPGRISWRGRADAPAAWQHAFPSISVANSQHSTLKISASFQVALRLRCH